MKKMVIVFTVLVIILSVSISLLVQGPSLKSEEIKDFSNITLPSYKLPAGNFTKGQVVKECLNASKRLLKNGQIPKNPQCIITPYGIYTKLFSPHFGLVNIPKNKLFYLVTVDVNRSIDERVSVSPSVVRMSDKEKARLMTHQDFYLVDPATGEIIAYGGSAIKWILPEQK